MSAFVFERASYLLLLGLLFPAVLLFVWWKRWQKRVLHQLGEAAFVRSRIVNRSGGLPLVKCALLMGAWVALITGIANPQTEGKTERASPKGADVVFAIDVSLSMTAEDVLPNRLEKAKKTLLQTVRSLRQEQIGIVAFAGQAYPYLPLTSDFSAADAYVAALHPTLVAPQGTSIPEALKVATQLLQGSTAGSRLIFILSDGETQGVSIRKVLPAIQAYGTKVYTIGFGQKEGAAIPLPEPAGNYPAYKKDHTGKTVLTRLEESTLAEVAAWGHGEYYRAENPTLASRFMLERIAERVAVTSTAKKAGKVDHYQPLLSIALLFLLLEVLLPEGKFFSSAKRQREV